MNRGGYSYYPATPPRTPAKTTASPRSSLGGSPPRKVATEFAAFGAPKEASVFGTAVARSPFSLAGGKAAFGGMRNAGVRPTFDDDDDEDGDPEADPTLLTRGPCRVHGLVRVVQARAKARLI